MIVFLLFIIYYLLHVASSKFQYILKSFMKPNAT